MTLADVMHESFFGFFNDRFRLTGIDDGLGLLPHFQKDLLDPLGIQFGKMLIEASDHLVCGWSSEESKGRTNTGSGWNDNFFNPELFRYP